MKTDVMKKDDGVITIKKVTIIVVKNAFLAYLYLLYFIQISTLHPKNSLLYYLAFCAGTFLVGSLGRDIFPHGLEKSTPLIVLSITTLFVTLLILTLVFQMLP